MTERIPQILAHLEHLREGQVETRQMLHDEMTNLKQDHIMDIRKNICRLWMAIQDLQRVRDRFLGAASFANIILTILGGLVGAGITIIFRHG